MKRITARKFLDKTKNSVSFLIHILFHFKLKFKRNIQNKEMPQEYSKQVLDSNFVVDDQREII